VFEFRFQVPNIGRRFKSAKIVAEFEDAGAGAGNEGNYARDPVVHKIVPDGSFALNRAEAKSTVTQGFSGSIKAGMDGVVGASLGFEWKVSKDVTKEHYASLSGTASNEREDEYGEDNAAIWWLSEDPEKKNGIPKWLRTAVLLRRTHDGPFLVRLAVDTNVDLLTHAGSFFGLGQMEPVDPVHIDPAKIANAVEDSATLSEMEKLDLLASVNVAFATPIEAGS